MNGETSHQVQFTCTSTIRHSSILSEYTTGCPIALNNPTVNIHWQTLTLSKQCIPTTVISFGIFFFLMQQLGYLDVNLYEDQGDVSKILHLQSKLALAS